MTTETRKRRNYTEDFKRVALALVIEPHVQHGSIRDDHRRGEIKQITLKRKLLFYSLQDPLGETLQVGE